MPRDTFHQEIQELEQLVVRMSERVGEAIERATHALIERDVALALVVAQEDEQVNDLQRVIRNHAFSIMARQAPVAKDLRELTTIQLVISELERMGDHAAGIAKQTRHIAILPPIDLPEAIPELAAIARSLVNDVTQAFVDANVAAARAISKRDDEIDLRYRALIDHLIVDMAERPETIPAATRILFIAHDLERIGDRVTNICEDIIFMVTGEIEDLN